MKELYSYQEIGTLIDQGQQAAFTWDTTYKTGQMQFGFHLKPGNTTTQAHFTNLEVVQH